jgi:hypothetical protein
MCSYPIHRVITQEEQLQSVVGHVERIDRTRSMRRNYIEVQREETYGTIQNRVYSCTGRHQEER